jgi:hypothetical protein
MKSDFTLNDMVPLNKMMSGIIFAAAVFGFFIVPTPASAATTLVVDNDAMASPTNCDASTPAYMTVSSAVADASAGDTIKVCDGMYMEQVTITTNSITLISVNTWGAKILAPPLMVDPKAIVRVNGATGVTITGFEISGPGAGTCGSLSYGIRVDGGGSATIQNDHITLIRDEPLSGCQNGVGIAVGRNAESTTGTATILNNVIDTYQKGGIVIDNTGSSALITGNEITGVASTMFIAQNGIQVSRGAKAEIRENQVDGNWFSGAFWTATGILVFESDSVKVQGNTVSNSQTGIDMESWCWKRPSASNNQVMQNTIDGQSDFGVTVFAVAFEGFSTCNPFTNNNKVDSNSITSENFPGDGDTGIFVGTDEVGTTPYSGTAYNNKVIGNTISGYMDAIDDQGTKTKVHANVSPM